MTTDAAGLPTPEPTITDETRPFWAAAAEGRLVIPRCRGCSGAIWYPRPFCPDCHGDDLEWVETSGAGAVYSFTVTRRGHADNPAYQDAPPYVLAYVELDEGPRILTNVVGSEPGTVRCGSRVNAVFHRAGDEAGLVRFTLSEED